MKGDLSFDVVVIGGGDTGADCVGTANRQGAKCVVQIEILPCPPEERPENQPWPSYPKILKTSSSHEEGCERKWSVATKEFIGKNGKVRKLLCEKEEDGRLEIDADLVILALGFLRANIKGKKFVCGDMRRGPSLIVWALAGGKQIAEEINESLTST